MIENLENEVQEINIQEQSQSTNLRGQNLNSSLSNRSNRRNNKSTFQVPQDQEIIRYQSFSTRQSQNLSLQNGKSPQGKDVQDKLVKSEKKHFSNQLSIKEDVHNEASSMCKSVSGKQIDINNSKIHQFDQQSNSSKIKVVYGNQVLQVRQNQSEIMDQMNSSMQSFHSKKSKDLQVYSAKDNKMLILEVRNPENIERLKCRIEAEEKLSQSDKNSNKSNNKIDINGNDKNEEQKSQSEQDKVLSCKICLEEGDSEKQGKIFTPCQCTGTCKWIHEECLKEWIISRYVHLQQSNNPRDFLKAECEICKHKYKMEFSLEYKFFKNNLFTRLGKKNFITCLCSILCIIAYILCLLFFIAFKGSDEDDSVNNQNNQNNNNNNNNGGNSSQYKNHDMSVQSYEYAIIIICSLLIILSIIVCVISTRQAFFKRRIGKWIIHKYQQNQKVQQDQQLKQINNNHNYQPNEDRQIYNSNRYHYNGQTFASTVIRQQTSGNNSRMNNSIRNNTGILPNRVQIGRRGDFAHSTQDQSIQQNSNIFNLRNSDLMGIQGSQHFILVQDQRRDIQQNNINNNQNAVNQMSIPNDDSLSQDNSKNNLQQNDINDIVRINSNLIHNSNNINNSYHFNNNNNNNNNNNSNQNENESQEINVFQFHNEASQMQNQSFNYADNY